MTEFHGEVRKAVRHLSNLAGVRHLPCFPYDLVRAAARPWRRSNASQ